MKSSVTPARLVGLAALFLALFSYPLLSIFNVGRLVGALPLLYGYVFAVWLLLIVLLARMASKGAADD